MGLMLPSKIENKNFKNSNIVKSVITRPNSSKAKIRSEKWNWPIENQIVLVEWIHLLESYSG